MKKLGIIAAKGDLSNKLIQYAVCNQIKCFVVAIEGEASCDLLNSVDHIIIKLGEVGKAITAMQNAKVEELVFVGSLKKPDIFSVSVDKIGAQLLGRIAKAKLFGDNNLLLSVINFLEDYNFKVIGVQDILHDIVVTPGNFTIKLPSKKDTCDINLAIKVIEELGKLDVGQAAIVERGVVLGVEGVEGTDNLIKRCSSLKRVSERAGVLVKFAKPGQELRIDLPTIGFDTIVNVCQSGFNGIVIQGNKSIFLDQEKVIEYANKNNLFISAV
jgi:UDP-2,3-diacylglucosamine hydrolase